VQTIINNLQKINIFRLHLFFGYHIINVGDRMDYLIKLRNDRKISCTDMANKLGISKTFYWQIENAKRRLTYKYAFKIARIFDMKPDDIFYKEFAKILK
jgi:putative transcriptional regulator